MNTETPTLPSSPKTTVASTVNVQARDLENWATACLESVEMPSEEAQLIARNLVQTSLWGIDSHGIARLPHYLNRITGGSIATRPNITVKSTGPCTARIDGDHGHGIVICDRAMREASRMALENGIGAVGVENSSHCGAIGLYGRLAASQGLVGFAFTHSDAFVAPHGGNSKFLGTNPICIAVPTEDPERPVCLDMATSAVSWNKVMNARCEGRALGEGWALDENGQPTTNAASVACLLPFAAHRGYALAFLIELLCGPLNGMPFGPHIPAMYGDMTEHRRLGSFMMAINPAHFGAGSSLAAIATQMANEARNQPRAGDGEVIVPGDPEYRCQEKRGQEGIPVETGLQKEISAWCEKLNLGKPF